MRPHVFIFINGIRAEPGDADGWTDRAVTWINCHTPHIPRKGEKFEYACWAVTRFIRQGQRVAALAAMIGYYSRAGFRVTLVGHSNGCAIIAKVLAVVGPKIDSAHLFAPAADGADFAEALREDRLGVLHTYGSKGDAALKFAGISRKLLGWAGLGYGNLGLTASEFAAQLPLRVFDHSDDTQGHSTWFDRGERFEKTMQLLTETETLLK